LSSSLPCFGSFGTPRLCAFPDIGDLFSQGLYNIYVQKAEYTVDTIDRIVGDFLEKDEEAVKDIRFNLLIDRKLNTFLKNSALQTGKTKAEIIRELLSKEMEP